MDSAEILRERARRCAERSELSLPEVRDQWLFLASCWLVVAHKAKFAERLGEKPALTLESRKPAPSYTTLSDRDIEQIAERMTDNARPPGVLSGAPGPAKVG